MNIFSLKDIDSFLNGNKTIIIGGGPSLDYLDHEIHSWRDENYAFVLTDVIAENFIRRWDPDRRIVFTVESRRHSFLKNLSGGELIAFYARANSKNLPQNIREVYSFFFDFDSDLDLKEKNKSLQLISPGTVSGAAFFWVLSRYIKFMNQSQNFHNNLKMANPEIYLAGFDLSYPENQMYNRYSYFRRIDNRFYNRPIETQEWMMTLKKADYAWLRNGNLIKTSSEFRYTKENLELMLTSLDKRIQIFDYSPLGIHHPRVQKKIPISLSD